MKEEIIFNSIKKKIERLDLSVEEKSLLRSNISEKLIESIPVRFEEAIPSPYVADIMSTRSIIKFNTKNMLIGALIAAILSGSVSFAAQSSLPGDTLYPVKISINENVQDLLAVSSVSQAKLDTVKIERRLEEAKALQQAGKLDAEKKDILKSEVASHIQSLKDELSKIEKSGDTEEAKNIKNNLGSLVSSERLSLPAGERGVGQMVNSATSTDASTGTSTVTASGTVIVSNIVASSTKGRGDEGGDEEEFDDFVKGLKDTVNNVSKHEDINDEKNNNEIKNNIKEDKSSENLKYQDEKKSEEVKKESETKKESEKESDKKTSESREESDKVEND